MIYVMDTDILTLFQEGHSVVQANVSVHPAHDIATTVISVEEQLSGWYALIRQTKHPDKLAWVYGKLAANVRALSRIAILDYDLPAIRQFETLRKLGLNVRMMDLRIAAIVLENNTTLVTRNARDFKQVPGLTFVDWSQ